VDAFHADEDDARHAAWVEALMQASLAPCWVYLRANPDAVAAWKEAQDGGVDAFPCCTMQIKRDTQLC